jgi:hypothetical protein
MNDIYFWYDTTDMQWHYGLPDGKSYAFGPTYEECLKNWLTVTEQYVPSTESLKGDTDAEEEKVVRFVAAR